MQIGILGGGRVAQAFAKYALKAGHTVVLSNSRGPESLSSVIANLGAGATAATVLEAARASIVLLAVHWDQVPGVLKTLPKWDGRILIDATNQAVATDDGFRVVDLEGKVSTEIVAGLAPGARLVKALNTLLMENFEADPNQGKAQRVVFLSGDSPGANGEVGALLKQFGFSVIELGNLAFGGRMQQLGGPLAGPDILQTTS